MVLHADIFVRSMDAALDFYVLKLGFSVVDDAVVNGPIVRNLSCKQYNSARLVLLRVSRTGTLLELQEFQQDSAISFDPEPLPTHRASVTILVPNLEDHIRMVKSNGLNPSSEVFVVHLPRQGTCNVVFYEDPDGNLLEFLEVLHTSPRQG